MRIVRLRRRRTPLRNFLNDVIAERRSILRTRAIVYGRTACCDWSQRGVRPYDDPASPSAILQSSERQRAARATHVDTGARRSAVVVVAGSRFKKRTKTRRKRAETGVREYARGETDGDIGANATSMTRDGFPRRLLQAITPPPPLSLLLSSLSSTSEPEVVVDGPADSACRASRTSVYQRDWKSVAIRSRRSCRQSQTGGFATRTMVER